MHLLGGAAGHMCQIARRERAVTSVSVGGRAPRVVLGTNGRDKGVFAAQQFHCESFVGLLFIRQRLTSDRLAVEGHFDSAASS